MREREKVKKGYEYHMHPVQQLQDTEHNGKDHDAAASFSIDNFKQDLVESGILSKPSFQKLQKKFNRN